MKFTYMLLTALALASSNSTQSASGKSENVLTFEDHYLKEAQMRNELLKLMLADPGKKQEWEALQKKQDDIFEEMMQKFDSSSDGTIVGKWEKCSTEGAVRSDGHFKRSNERITLWLREDGRAQYVRNSSWTSYQGATEGSGEFGSGESIKSIRASTGKGYRDRFLFDSSTPADGTWKIFEDVVKLEGNGHYSACAVEDDDLLYHGGGPMKGVTFEVSLDALRSDYVFTSVKSLGRNYAEEEEKSFLESATPAQKKEAEEKAEATMKKFEEAAQKVQQ